MRYVIGLTVFGCVLPLGASAAVVINEVAWMGTDTSANDEWIELYNNGDSAADVTGWTLTDDRDLEISLEGSIGAGAYAVLERTDDTSAPDDAFLIYTGSLINSGGTLVLKRADDSVADQVAGGENWQSIGGDNTTKETAQLTSGGWITAKATPGAANKTTGSTNTNDDEGGDNTSDGAESNTSDKSNSDDNDDGGDSNESTSLTLPDVELSLAIEAPARGYVNQPVQFAVEPSGIAPTLLDSLTYRWNFGNGAVKAGKEPSQQFAYPGTYVVTVYGKFARHEQVARHEITILPVELTLTENEDGDIQINNTASYEVDISGYALKGAKSVTFPPHTILLAKNTITIPREEVAPDTEFLVSLFDGEEQLLATNHTAFAGVEEAERAEADAAEATASAASASQNSTNASGGSVATFASEQPQTTTTLQTATNSTTSSPATNTSPTTGPQAAAVGASGFTLPENWPYFGLVGLLLVGTLGVFATGRGDQS